MPDTPDRDAIRRRLEAATPGPWEIDDCGWDREVSPREHIVAIDGPEHGVLCHCASWQLRREDAEFIAHAPADIAALLAYTERLEKALEPFAHPDLCEQLVGNGQGDASPVFGRNKALLTLGDFRRARAALVRREGKSNA